jgi:lysozyme family protein
VDEIDRLLQREGGYTNNPNDRGGETDMGITRRDHPEAWADGKVTRDEARAIYEKKYVEGPGFGKLAPSPLREQLIDFGANSGPAIAIMKLQEILGVEADGVFGPQTLAALAMVEMRPVNNLLVASRLRMLANLVAKRPAQVQFLRGWVNRALEFLVP